MGEEEGGLTRHPSLPDNPHTDISEKDEIDFFALMDGDLDNPVTIKKMNIDKPLTDSQKAHGLNQGMDKGEDDGLPDF